MWSGDEGEWSRDPLPKMLVESIFRCERDQVSPAKHADMERHTQTRLAHQAAFGLCAVQQAQLISSVVVAGGGACVEGTMERLKLEVETQLAGQSQVSPHSHTGRAYRGTDLRCHESVDMLPSYLEPSCLMWCGVFVCPCESGHVESPQGVAASAVGAQDLCVAGRVHRGVTGVVP